MDAVKLKKSSTQLGWLVGLSRQLTHSCRGKNLTWEEFGEAMEEDYWMASKRFWQTVGCPGIESSCSFEFAGPKAPGLVF